MQKIRRASRVAAVLMGMSLAAALQPASAGVEEECRQEAEDYGVMPETRDEYVIGCINSRGGPSTAAGPGDDYVEAAETGDSGSPGMEGEQAAE